MSNPDDDDDTPPRLSEPCENCRTITKGGPWAMPVKCGTCGTIHHLDERIELTGLGDWLASQVSVCLLAGFTYEDIWDALDVSRLTYVAKNADTPPHEHQPRSTE